MEEEKEEKKENPKQDPKEFGHVIDALHNKSKLSSLRTYQGDMAEFIHEKDESVVSIVVKEKERKEKEEKLKPLVKPEKGVPGNLSKNIVRVLVALLLIVGSIFAVKYVIGMWGERSTPIVVLKEEILPYTSMASLSNVDQTDLLEELWKNREANGIEIVKIADGVGVVQETARQFFSYLKTPIPASLSRTLGDDYFIGVSTESKKSAPFLVFKVNDFGIAFSQMIEWEKNIHNDLDFLVGYHDTATTTTLSWRDVIVKNKDTRVLFSNKEEVFLVYTFLDKNTILIGPNLNVIVSVSSVYAARSVAR